MIGAPLIYRENEDTEGKQSNNLKRQRAIKINNDLSNVPDKQWCVNVGKNKA